MLLGTARAVPGFTRRAPVRSESPVSRLEVPGWGRERGCQTLHPAPNGSPGCILQAGVAAEVGSKRLGREPVTSFFFFFFLNFPLLGVEVRLKRNRPKLQVFILSVVLHRSVLFFHPQDAQGLDIISIIKTPPLYSRPRRPENFNSSSTIYPLEGEKQQTNSTGALLHDTGQCLHPALRFQGARMGGKVWGEEKTTEHGQDPRPPTASDA